MFTFETKSNLAKLLATENITMQHNPAAHTAYFDIKTRVLTLPVWKNISEDLYDLLVVHEVGHALDTNMDKWLEGINKLSKKFHGEKPSTKQFTIIKGYFNVIEDVRIDKRQKRRYPGSRKNYIKGYAELLERDFMGVNGKDLDSLPFIDRVNLYYKGGYNLGMKFSPEEKRLMKLMDDAETFDDVTKIVEAVYAYSKENEKEKQKQKDEESDEDVEVDEFEEFEDGDDSEFMESDEGEESDEDEEGPGSGTKSDEDEDDEENEKQSSKSSEENDDEENSSNSSETDDGSDADQNNNEDDSALESMTEKKERETAQSLVDASGTEFVYIDLPKIIHSVVVSPINEVKTSLTSIYGKEFYYFSKDEKDKQVNKFREWKLKEKEAISFMIQEFESKKAADTYARTSISKTGILDTNKAYSYKYNDDLFRKMTTIAEGKNHGFVMFMDWSGSMNVNLQHTLKQLFSLVMFCKKVQIPFDVYLFRDWSATDGDLPTGKTFDGRQTSLNAKGKTFYENTSESRYILRPFKYRNVLSSQMNITDLNKMMESLWLTAFVELATDKRHGTPLNEAIMGADVLINDFKKKHRIQIVSTIFLTDGGADFTDTHIKSNVQQEYGKPRPRRQMIINDKVTKQTYFYDGTNQKFTSTLLKILKDRTGCKMVGFYIAPQSLSHLGSVVDRSILDSEATKTAWRENGFFATKQSGYDEYYIMNVAKLSNSAESKLYIDSAMSNARAAKEFAKFSGKKRINRTMLSRFIALIAVE